MIRRGMEFGGRQSDYIGRAQEIIQRTQKEIQEAAIPKYSFQQIRMRASPPKIVVLSNAMLAATDQNIPPDPLKDPKRHGAWVENACLALAWNSGQKVTYWREEPYEVDGIIEGSWGNWAVEVKTGGFNSGDLGGLFEFTKQHPHFRPLVLCDPSDVKKVERINIRAIAWQEFLLKGFIDSSPNF